MACLKNRNMPLNVFFRCRKFPMRYLSLWLAFTSIDIKISEISPVLKWFTDSL